MQGTEKASKRRLSTAFLCVLTGGAMVALVGLMVSAPGCNTIFPPDPCANVDCDDDNLCTTDTCVEGECVYTDVVCTNGYECDEATGECVETDPCEGVTCDDEDLCTTDECVDGECVYTAVECAEGETCDPATGDCVAIECEEDADCDDADVCTTDACVDGICVNGDLCAADEICTAAGECVECEEDADCGDDEVCTAGVCVEATACTEDADCDDGLYCNGVETCNTNGVCLEGTAPCDADTETCEEGDAGAECVAIPSETLDFTLGQDNLTGTTGNDDFLAALLFNSSTATQVASLQVGDSANGLAGDDTLTATFNPTAATTVVPQSLAGIETYYLTNFGSNTQTLQATNITGMETVYTKNSVDDISVASLSGVVNAGFIGLTDANDMLQLDFVTAATTGSADAMTCYVENTTAGELELKTGSANGIESLTFNSTGSTANKLSQLDQDTGTTLATLYFTGNIGFTPELEADNTVRTFDASGMTVSSPGVTLGKGTRADGTDNFTAFNTVDIKSVTGSNGDDTFIFGTTLNGSDADQTGEKIDGGTGDDVLQATFASTLATALPIDNIETLRVNATSAGGFSLLNVTDVTGISVEADAAATALAISNVPVTGTTQTWPTLSYRGDGTATGQIYDTVTYTPFGATAATGDSLTVAVGNRGTALNTSGTTNQHTIAQLTLANLETLTLNVTDGPLTMSTGVTGGTLINMTVTGSSNVALGTVTATGNTVTSFDASGVTGNFSAVVDCFNGGTINLGSGNDTLDLTGSGAANASTIQCGAGNDTITGTGATDAITGGAGTDTLNGAAGADTINGGDDVDTITGGTGIDSITTGNGADIVVFNSPDTANRCTISDFTPGASGDVALFDISDLGLAGGDEYVGVLGSVNVGATEEIVILTGAGYANQGAADTAINARITGANLDVVYFYFDTTSNTTKIIHFTNAAAAGSTLIGELTNITTQAVHDTLTVANINSQA